MIHIVLIFVLLCGVPQSIEGMFDFDPNSNDFFTQILTAMIPIPEFDFSKASQDDAQFDCYALFGVSSDASASEIKKAYHRALLRHHPDKVGADNSMIRKVNISNEVLSKDENKKLIFDAFGYAGVRLLENNVASCYRDTQRQRPQPGWFNGVRNEYDMFWLMVRHHYRTAAAFRNKIGRTYNVRIARPLPFTPLSSNTQTQPTAPRTPLDEQFSPEPRTPLDERFPPEPRASWDQPIPVPMRENVSSWYHQPLWVYASGGCGVGVVIWYWWKNKSQDDDELDLIICQ